MKMKTKVAYEIRTGDMNNLGHVSAKLRCRASIKRAIRAAKRLGFPNAYAAKMMVNIDDVLK